MPARPSTGVATVFLPVQQASLSPTSTRVSHSGCSHGCSHLRRIAARTGQLTPLPGLI